MGGGVVSGGAGDGVCAEISCSVGDDVGADRLAQALSKTTQIVRVIRRVFVFIWDSFTVKF